MALLLNCCLHGFLTVLLWSWGVDLLLALRLNVSLPSMLCELYIGLSILQYKLLVLLWNRYLLAIKCWCGGALTRLMTRQIDCALDLLQCPGCLSRMTLGSGCHRWGYRCKRVALCWQGGCCCCSLLLNWSRIS